MLDKSKKPQKGKKVFSNRGTSFLTLSSSYTNQLPEKETKSLGDMDSVQEEYQSEEEIKSVEDITSPDERPMEVNEPPAHQPPPQLEETRSYLTEEEEPETQSPSISTRIYSLKKESAKEAEDAREELKRMLLGDDKPSPKNKVSQTKPITKQMSKKIIDKLAREGEGLDENKIIEIADKVTTVLDWASHAKTAILTPFMKFKDHFIYFLKDRFEILTLVWTKIVIIFKPQVQKMIYPFIYIKELAVHWWEYRNNPQPEEEDVEEETEEGEPPVPPVSFLDLAEKGIIFTDNKKRPLYTQEQLRGKGGYSASEAVFKPIIMENIINAFKEVAPKAKAVPTPQTGKYAGIPMNEVMDNIEEEEIMVFLNYVLKYPRGYIGKNFRITESFAGWVVSGTPED